MGAERRRRALARASDRRSLVPYLVLYRDGAPVASTVGARSKEAVEHALGLKADVELPAA